MLRIQRTQTIGQAQIMPNIKPPNLLIVGVGSAISLTLVALFAYWNEGRR
jgi:hypothetical protein